MTFFGVPQAPADLEVPQPPTDPISSVSLAVVQGVHYLFAGSWDSQVRAWEVRKDTGAITPKASISHTAPVLSVSTAPDGACFSASCDNTVKMWRLGSEPVQVAQHDKPVSAVVALPEMGAVLTASWDKTARLWDLRSSPAKAQGTVPLPERCYAMAAVGQFAVFACADRNVVLYDLTSNASHPQLSPLRFQTRSVCCFADKSGYALSSIEGRIAVQNFNPQNPSRFKTRCHRGPDNKLPSHPSHSLAAFPLPQRADVFASAGGDGMVNFYDKTHRNIVHKWATPQPLVAGQFSSDGALYAYATGDDLMRGPEGPNPAARSGIRIHRVTEQELAPKPKAP